MRYKHTALIANGRAPETGARPHVRSGRWRRPTFDPRTADRRGSLAMLAPAAVILIVTNIYPIGYALWTSFRQDNPSIPGSTNKFIGLANYRRLFTDPAFLQSVRITLEFVAVAVPLEMIVGLLLAFLISRRHRLIFIVRIALLLPFIMAPAAAGVLWRTLYNVNWGPFDYFLHLIGLPQQQFLSSPSQALNSIILVDVWQQVPPVAFVVAAGLLSIPPDMFEAARIDGASKWQTFTHITIPLLKPAIFVVLLLRVMDAFKTFDIVATATQGGPASATNLLSYLTFLTGTQTFDLGYASAQSWVFLLVILVISLGLVRALNSARRSAHG